jgi:hypothetical protein
VPLGRDVVLMIDEAQDLSPELLEQIRLLSNLETDRQKLLQIVLLGQPELLAMLDRAELRQLRQRITVRYHLTPLSRDETELYVQWRLQVAGARNGRPAFSPRALRRVHRFARGIPRLVNAVCDTALLAGYVDGVDVLGPEHVRRAVARARGQALVSLVRDALAKAEREAAARAAREQWAAGELSDLPQPYRAPPPRALAVGDRPRRRGARRRRRGRTCCCRIGREIQLSARLLSGRSAGPPRR